MKGTNILNEPTWCSECTVQLCEKRLMRDDAICFYDYKRYNNSRIYSRQQFENRGVVKPLDKNTETLGAHLRNLLTPYKNLIQMNRDGMDISKYLETVQDNFNDLLDFSNTAEMENNYYVKK